MHNVRNALAAIAVGARAGLGAADAGRRAARVQGHQAAARDRRRAPRRHRARRLRASSDGGARDAGRAADRLSRARRIWAVFEPRSASSCRRVFQDDFAARLRRRRRSGHRRRCSGRRCPRPSGCRPSSSSTICARAGQRARHIPDVDDIVATVVARAPRRRRRRADVERRLRRHPPEAAAGARGVTSAPDPRGRRLGARRRARRRRSTPAVNARAMAMAAAAARRRRSPACATCVPTFRSVAVYFDPLRADRRRAAARVLAAAPRTPRTRPGGRAIEMPVEYGGEAGPDLDAVAARRRAARRPTSSRGTRARDYRVFMLGFLPGFAYLGPVDAAIAAPRRASPRLRVPAGSVGIAGRQTGVYPQASPGGWQIIGRTDDAAVRRRARAGRRCSRRAIACGSCRCRAGRSGRSTPRGRAAGSRDAAVRRARAVHRRPGRAADDGAGRRALGPSGRGRAGERRDGSRGAARRQRARSATTPAPRRSR